LNSFQFEIFAYNKNINQISQIAFPGK